MTRRLERDVLGVAVLATERRLDHGVAHQAIGHLRQGRARHPVGLLQPAVTSLAGIPGVQAPANVEGWLEVIAVVHGGGDKWRDIAHLEMQRVAEPGHQGGNSRPRRGQPGFFVAFAANLPGGEQVVLRLGTGGRGLVTFRALQSHPEMHAMGKGLRPPRRAPGEKHQQERSQNAYDPV